MRTARDAVLHALPLVLFLAVPGCNSPTRTFSRIAAHKEARLRRLLADREGRLVTFRPAVEGRGGASYPAKITLSYTEAAYETNGEAKEDAVSEEVYLYAFRAGKWVFTDSYATGFSGRLAQANPKRYITREELTVIMTEMPE